VFHAGTALRDGKVSRAAVACSAPSGFGDTVEAAQQQAYRSPRDLLGRHAVPQGHRLSAIERERASRLSR